MRLAAIIAGAFSGAGHRHRVVRAADSIGGTSTFRATVKSSHPSRIGTANLRTNRMNFGRVSLSVFMRPSPDRKFGRACPASTFVLDLTVDGDAAPDVVAIALCHHVGEHGRHRRRDRESPGQAGEIRLFRLGLRVQVAHAPVVSLGP